MSRSRCASACLASEAVSAATRSWSACALATAAARVASARLMAMSRSASAVATSASRLMRATSGPTHVGDVLTLVPHFLDGEADDLQPHLAHVCRAGGAHAVTHHFRFLDDLLDGELPDDSPEMAFHHQANQAFPLSR